MLKALILSAIPLALFGLLRRGPGDAGAAAAALALGLLPSVAWESQRALTHSPLALLMAVATAWAAVRALRGRRWRHHAALGLAVGLGVLSKFNFVLWPLGLLVAAVLLPEWRARVRPLRVLGAVGVAAVVVAPVGLWMLANPELATGSVEKMSSRRRGRSRRG
jgi:4-amino-4-deoxy-L-arabinose transferase-like glycosyltransferase